MRLLLMSCRLASLGGRHEEATTTTHPDTGYTGWREGAMGREWYETKEKSEKDETKGKNGLVYTGGTGREA